MHDLTYDIYQLRLGKQFHKIRFMSNSVISTRDPIEENTRWYGFEE